jgi:SAM-dependent methyltransferase
MLGVVDDDVRFAPDLYRGTAGYYDRFRLPYPEAMIDDLAHRVGPSGHGRLLDLACGTGQLAFPLRGWFAEVWAVDQEPDMIELIRAKAASAGAAGKVRAVVSAAEDLRAEPGHFELVVIGNAFHRLPRDVIAGRVLGWLEPGGYLALCWSDSPWTGGTDWQRVLDATLQTWTAARQASDRIPAGWDRDRKERPDPQVLSAVGFEVAGSHEFTSAHSWTIPELTGFVRSTSFLPPSVLGDQAAAFDAGLAGALGPYVDGGYLTAPISFTYELARKPS